MPSINERDLFNQGWNVQEENIKTYSPHGYSSFTRLRLVSTGSDQLQISSLDLLVDNNRKVPISLGAQGFSTDFVSTLTDKLLGSVMLQAVQRLNSLLAH